MAEAEQFDGVAAVAAGDVLIVLWRAAARVHRARWVHGQVERIAKRAATGFVLVQLILPSSNPPDKACRDEATATFKTYRGVMRQMLTVPLGDSLWTNIVRAIIRAAVVLTGNAAQHEIASSVADAIAKIRARERRRRRRRAASWLPRSTRCFARWASGSRRPREPSRKVRACKAL